MGKISKNDELFFDSVAKAVETKDIKLFNQIQVALSAFLMQPKMAIKKKIQAVGVSTDFAQLTKDAYNVTVQEDNFDLGWERVFRTVTLGKNQDS